MANFILTGTSPASASTVAGTVATGLASDPAANPLGDFLSMRIEATLQGATGGTLDVYIQCSYDAGVSWSDYAHFTQLAAGAASVVYGVSVSKANPSTLVTVGKNTTPALAANTCRDGEWGDRIRVLFVAGAGTSAGATQTIKVFCS